ncbi:hypothetical protein [Algoriphagus aquimarinus]|uniref:Uncharacterized protein n=1 Tax=Algoriphagus aquimarinus TaxID=237018 RepID=A0A5C7ARR1_9BACT|nr:hypothetical protein [Algoriphagus aquimarinus]TXE11408.1 hypothetical protein ESV85_10820 [Algoriphagus aquimarinus]
MNSQKRPLVDNEVTICHIGNLEGHKPAGAMHQGRSQKSFQTYGFLQNGGHFRQLTLSLAFYAMKSLSGLAE